MFTGIIEEIGEVLSITEYKITVKADLVLQETKIGDSIAVNGVCLTVANIEKNSFSADVSPETINVTALGFIRAGDIVNLERALPANGRFGGHIVSGHTDGKGKIKTKTRVGNFYNIEFELDDSLLNYVVKKGSITINGISLTVAGIKRNAISIAVIPHTYENTNLKFLKIGDFVNVETDILAKYVEKFLSTSDNRTGISVEFLRENGF